MKLVTEIIELEEIDSTNTYALAQGRPGLLVCARVQGAGRGRRGRAWFSPPGENLYLTFTLAGVDMRFPLVTGVALREALSELLPQEDVRIKWPNDILLARRKLCGILCESSRGITAVGIGLNVNTRTWPPEIADRATSLAVCAGRTFGLDAVRQRILAALERTFERFENEGFGAIRETFVAHSYLKGQKAILETGQTCRILDLGQDGSLMVDVAGEVLCLTSGEIVLADEFSHRG